MADTDPNATPPANTDPNATPPVDELAQLREFAGSVRKALALGDDADSAAVLSSLSSLGNASKELADTKAAWASEKVSGTLQRALEASGIKPEFMEDAMLRAVPFFTVDAKGNVVTRADAKDTIPGSEPAAWIRGELMAKVNGRYWDLSVGGGAGTRGTGLLNTDAAGADSMFDPRSPSHNFSAQLRYEQSFGSVAADRARAKYRHRGKGFV